MSAGLGFSAGEHRGSKCARAETDTRRFVDYNTATFATPCLPRSAQVVVVADTDRVTLIRSDSLTYPWIEPIAASPTAHQ